MAKLKTYIGDLGAEQRGGVYLLFCRGTLVYVGKSIDMANRINDHRVNGREFQHALQIPLVPEIADWVKRELIRSLAPKQNVASKPLSSLELLERKWRRHETWDDERAPEPAVAVKVESEAEAEAEVESESESDALSSIEFQDFDDSDLPQLARNLPSFVATTAGLPKTLTMKEIVKVVPYTKVHLYRLMKENEFPPAVRLGPSRVVWWEDEVLSWLRNRQQKGHRRRPTSSLPPRPAALPSASTAEESR